MRHQDYVYQIEKMLQLLRDFVPKTLRPPNPLPGLRSWTPLGDFCPPDPLILAPPLPNPKYATEFTHISHCRYVNVPQLKYLYKPFHLQMIETRTCDGSTSCAASIEPNRVYRRLKLYSLAPCRVSIQTGSYLDLDHEN